MEKQYSGNKKIRKKYFKIERSDKNILKLKDYVPSLTNTNVALLYFNGTELCNKMVKKKDIKKEINKNFMDMEVNDANFCIEDDCIEIWLM